MKWLLSLVLAGSLFGSGLTCVSNASVSTAWNNPTTWNNCGATGPLGFDSASFGAYSASGTETWAHTVGSGTNRILIVFVFGSSLDQVTGVTYNGSALTLVQKYHGTIAWHYAYALINPPTGTANVVVSSAGQMGGLAASYSGARQTSNPEAVGTNTTISTTTPSVNVTTATDGAWVVGYFANGSTSYTAGSGNTRRIQGLPEFGNLTSVFDTNALISPAQTYTMTVNSTLSVVSDAIAVSVAPVSAPSGGSYPQSGDTATVGTNVVLTSDVSVTSIAVNGANALLQTDGVAAHTVTTSAGITVSQGCSAIAGVCTAPYAVDTSAASTGKEVTFAYSGSAGTYDLSIGRNGGALAVNLNHTIISAGSGSGISIGGDAVVALTFNLQNSEITGGVEGIDVTTGAGATLVLLVNNVSSTGLTTGPLIHAHSAVPTTCTLSNITWSGMTSGLPMFYSLADVSKCVLTGNAMISDAAGVNDPEFMQFGVGATYSLGKSYFLPAGTDQNGIKLCGGSISSHCVYTNSVLDGFSQPFYLGSGDYQDLTGNVCIAHAAIGNEQGCFFGFGNTHTTDQNNVLVAPQGTTANFGLFYLGSGSAPISNMAISRDTIVNSPAATGAAGVSFGEGGAGANLNVTSTSITASLVYGGFVGILDNDAANVYTTGGTGGVGVWSNDVFNAITPYTSPQRGTNFDNGATHHPSATYDDVTMDPKIYNMYRTWADCDKGFGGPGTTANLFAQLFNRWNGTNDPGYTAQRIYTCMRAPYAPREIRLANAASDGSYIGALKPIGLVGMAFSQ